LILGMKQQWKAIQKPYLQQAPKMMSLQIANTLITYLQYWLILNLFIPITWLNACIRMGLTQFSNSIPITIAGLGLRESFAIHFLRSTGINAEQAVSATLSLFLIQDVLPALVGAYFLIRTKRIAG
ncbi:MAG: lysylphosphatidylglycerol synthase domain-containing protein, partial [Candidatus Cloacimonetes bacterium]|nr:lysylphosphatidylglycerol synthase domain-containing protein [Candidatus Cloacimonadota bacterium]